MPYALQFHAFGEPSAVVHQEEVEKLKIELPSHILIRVIAAPINPSDLNVISGTYGVKPSSFPATSGLEGVGIIEEIGTEITKYQIGQRVHFCVLGTWRDYVLIDTNVNKAIVPVHNHISDCAAAQLTANPLTVAAMVKDLNVTSGSGDFLLQSGASSALGRIMIQYAKAKGFKTINIVRRAEQLEQLKQLGADHVINSETEDITARVKEITNDEGVKYAIDCVGGKTGTQIIKSLGKNGQCLVFGRLDKEPTELPYGMMIFKEAVVRGFWLSQWAKSHPELVPGLYEDLITLILQKELVLASRAFPVFEFKAALEHCTTPGKTQKTVLLLI